MEEQQKMYLDYERRLQYIEVEEKLNGLLNDGSYEDYLSMVSIIEIASGPKRELLRKDINLYRKE